MGEDRDRDDQGRYTEEVTLEDALALFTDAEPRTTKEVAEELDIVRRTAYNKLQELHEQGELKKKDVGARGVVWWNPNPDPETDTSC